MEKCFLFASPGERNSLACFPCCLYIILAAGVAVCFDLGVHYTMIIWLLQGTCSGTYNMLLPVLATLNNCKSIAGEVQAIKAIASSVWSQGTRGLWKLLPCSSTAHCLWEQTFLVSSLKIHFHRICRRIYAPSFVKTLWKFKDQYTRATFMKYRLKLWAPLKSVAKVLSASVRSGFHSWYWFSCYLEIRRFPGCFYRKSMSSVFIF